MLLAITATTQYYSDLENKERQLIPPTIISARAIKMGDLGLHSAAASAMWVYTIQKATESSEKLPELIRNVNSIDPKFSYPYAFAVLVLPDITNLTDEAIEIGEDGIKNADKDWRIPYYLATTYHISLKNREKAAFYFEIASRTPGAPETVRSMPARYGKYTDTREQTKQIWASIYESSNDEVVKERALNFIKQLDFLDALEKGAGIYRQRYGKYPQNLEELVRVRILKEIPKSPIGLEFYINEVGKIKY